jgi:hypothetical protein
MLITDDFNSGLIINICTPDARTYNWGLSWWVVVISEGF